MRGRELSEGAPGRAEDAELGDLWASPTMDSPRGTRTPTSTTVQSLGPQVPFLSGSLPSDMPWKTPHYHRASQGRQPAGLSRTHRQF